MISRALIAWLTILFAISANAQGFGPSAILNPEGSRLFPQSLTYPRHPGKPEARWRSFDWRYTDVTANGANYRLYFYPEEEQWAARFAIPRINRQIALLEKIFSITPKIRFNYVLFTSLQDFQQANIFSISEGVQGVTSTTEATMAIPYWGHADEFDHISLHEMTHQFQYQKMITLNDTYGSAALAALPLWLIEGMAEYYSHYNAVDPETRFFMRDLLVNPKKDDGYQMPNFFEEGPLSFITVYKVGQAKIDFLEKQFGTGTVQRILEMAAKPKEDRSRSFSELLTTLTKLKEADVETKWKEYLDSNYRAEANHLTQTMDEFPEFTPAGQDIDLYDVSPDGTLMATRQIDPLTGTTSIQIIDLKNGNKKVEATHDRTPGTLTLYFAQLPVLAISNAWVSYVVATTAGPELELRSLFRDSDGSLKIGDRTRIELHRYGMIQAHSPAIHPDGKTLAFVALSRKGWENVYSFDLSSLKNEPKQVTQGYYSWRDLNWLKNNHSLVCSSDFTENAKYNLAELKLETGMSNRVAESRADQLAPDGSLDHLYFQSWEGGTSQIHLLSLTESGRPRQTEIETQLTDSKTGLMIPKERGDHLYTLGFRGGRYHIYDLPKSKLLAKTVRVTTGPLLVNKGPWRADVATLSEKDVHEYKAFRTSGIRVDNLFGFIGTGSVGGISGQVSDLMRNYSISGEFYVLGSFKYTNADAIFASTEGKTTWVVGPYLLAQPRVDTLFVDETVNTYLYREFGALGAIEYPLGAFAYLDFELRVAGVRRTDFDNPTFDPQWEAFNPGTEIMTAPVFRIGYDRITYEQFTGPFQGYGVLLESETNWFPSRGDETERLRLDAAYYLRLWGRTVLAVQGLAGAAWSGLFKNPFLISSDDILRGYPVFDGRLYGTHVVAGRTEVRFPLGSIFGFPPLRGLVGGDIGTVYIRPENAIQGVETSWSAGLQVNIPPISIGLLSSQPIRQAPGPDYGSVFHFTLRYLYL